MAYTTEQVLEISLLRQERWALYATLGDIKQAPGKPLYHRIANRIAVVNKRLFTLTDNPIYPA